MNPKYAKLNIIGVDETGVGDYLTPLVASAVFIPRAKLEQIQALGIKDSKKLSDFKILKLAPLIKKIVYYKTKHLSQEGYNKLNRSFNINELKTFLNLQNINNLNNYLKTKIDLVIIDRYASHQKIIEYQTNICKNFTNIFELELPFKSIVRGETEHLAVATASILAREKFLNLMKQQNQIWKCKFLFGTNAKVIEQAQEFVNQYGQENLVKVAKLKFKTTQKVLENL